MHLMANPKPKLSVEMSEDALVWKENKRNENDAYRQ